MKNIAVFITFYNEKVDYVVECLDSVILSKKDFLKYYPDNDVKIYVSFDDKNNLDIIDYVKGLNRDDIIININKQNLGCPKNSNVLLRMLPSNTDLVLRLDGDDVMVFNRIRITYEIFYNYDFFADVSMIGCNTTNPTFWNKSIMKLFAMNNYQHYNNVAQFEFNPICHSTIAFRYKDIIGNNVFYDENINLYCDLDLYLNVMSHGLTIMIVPDALVYYRDNNVGSMLRSGKDYSSEISYLQNKYKNFRCNVYL